MELDESNIDNFTKELKKVAQIDTLILETKDMMKPLKERLKQLQTEKKQLEKELCPMMEKNDLKQAELPNNIGTVHYKVKQAMIPITQKNVREKIEFFFREGPGRHISFNSKNPEEKGKEIFEFIYGKQNRQFVKKEELKTKEVKN